METFRSYDSKDFYHEYRFPPFGKGGRHFHWAGEILISMKYSMRQASGQFAAFLKRVQTHFLDPNGLALFRCANFIKLN